MRNKLAIAVASILASAAASAANVDLYISGASAQSAFWKADFGTSVCGGAGNIKTYKLSPDAGVTNPVSNEAWRCNAAAAVGTGVAIGDQVTVHYNSEFGTISGVASLVRPSVAQRLYVNPDSTDCPAVAAGGTSQCAYLTYNNTTETHTSTSGNVMVVSPNTLPADVNVLDMEIKFWKELDNWQTVPAFGLTPITDTEIAAIPATATVVNGQVFSVIANNSSPIAAKGNISKASLMAIVTGAYDTWGKVPEVGGGNTTPIKLCRREQGSGTQVAASVFFTGKECGYSSTSYASVNTPLKLVGHISEETSTGNVRTCVQGDTGAIGITSLSTNTNWTTLNIDGVQPNAHNAASGMYQFAFEDIVYNNSANSGASQGAKDLAGLFITNARKVAGLSSQIESTATQGANGQWTATTRRSNYALPIPGVNTKSVANAASITQAVTALGYRAGDNCKVLFNSNLN